MKFLVIPVFAVMLVSCGSGNKSPLPDNNATVTTHPIGLQEKRSINTAGLQRSYYLFVPEEPSKAKTVLLLHGNRGSSEQILGLERTKSPHKLWLDVARRDNVLLIVPDGEIGSEGHRGWNDCRNDAPTNPTSDDVLFLSTLLDTVATEFNTEDKKAFVVGTSNGGVMSMRLADQIPEKLHAFAAVVASRPLNSKCSPANTPVSALFMNGTADPILPYAGGHIKPQRGELFSTIDTVAYWINRNQTTTAVASINLPDINTRDNSTVTLYEYKDGTNGTQVRHYEVVGGGHTEPSTTEKYGALWKAIVGQQNNDIETVTEIWSFFTELGD